MNLFKIGDRVCTAKGVGTVIARHKPAIMPSAVYFVRMDNGKRIQSFLGWGLVRITDHKNKEEENDDQRATERV